VAAVPVVAEDTAAADVPAVVEATAVVVAAVEAAEATKPFLKSF
jgi:hypothetical protein